jgi:hypothetical protein
MKSGASARIVVVDEVVEEVTVENELEKEDVVEREGDVEFSVATKEEANNADDDSEASGEDAVVVDRRICGLKNSRFAINE